MDHDHIENEDSQTQNDILLKFMLTVVMHKINSSRQNTQRRRLGLLVVLFASSRWEELQS